MAYSDYGAFVRKDGERRRDKEDVGVYDTEEAQYGSGMRIWANLIKRGDEGSFDKPWRGCHHGVMGDGNVRVTCYKQGFPSVWVWEDGAEEPKRFTEQEIIEHNGWTVDDPWIVTYDYCESVKGKLYIDAYDYRETIEFTAPGLEGYEFTHTGGKPYEATMREPDGTYWSCEYDYWFGAGFGED